MRKFWNLNSARDWSVAAAQYYICEAQDSFDYVHFVSETVLADSSTRLRRSAMRQLGKRLPPAYRCTFAKCAPQVCF
jgi:hypothetical protein